MFETTNQIINPIINLTSLLICGLKPFSSPQAWSLSLFQNHLPKHLILESNGPWNIRKVKLTKIAGPDLSHLSPFRHVPPCSAMFRHVPPGHILHDLQQFFMRVGAGKRQLRQDLAVVLATHGPHWASSGLMGWTWTHSEGPTPTWLWIASGNSWMIWRERTWP